MYDEFKFSGLRRDLKVGDYSLIIHKSAYHLFSVLISKRHFPSLQTRKTFGEILSGNHRFLIPVITVVMPHNWTYLLHHSSHFYATKVLSIEHKDFLQVKADFLSWQKSLACSLRIFVNNFSLLSPLQRVLVAWFKIFN